MTAGVKGFLRACLLAALVSVAAPSGALLAQEPARVSARQITAFQSRSDETRFGRLQFLGGISFSSSDRRVQSLSGIRFREDGRGFVAVTDIGNWITGRIERDTGGRLSGLADVEVAPILYRGGRPGSKYHSDAEALVLRHGKAIVAFEQLHRIEVYPDPAVAVSAPERTLDLLIPRRELRRNAGLEALAAAPGAGPLKGALVTVAEHSLDADGNFFAAILEGPLKGIFKVARHDPYDVTDAAFLPDGDLLLLERRYSYPASLGMRIRRVAGDTIRPGALVDGEVLIDVGMAHAIDNMEGIDVIAGPDGRPHVIVVSDDNGNILQRNLMLEFRLLD